jgi:hypothetical protein
MALARYAGVGEVCPNWGITVESGGFFTNSGTLYFSFQLQNRAGFNIPSVSHEVAYSPNQKIVLTIPESVKKPGWDIHYYVLSCGNSADPSTHVQIARVPGFQWGEGIQPQSVRTELPVSIELSRNGHVTFAPSVATLADLPVGADRLDGQARWVTSESKWFEYRADSTLPIGVDVAAADIGRWVRIGGASTYVSNTEIGVGSDRAITDINPVTVIPTPSYPIGNSKVLPLWSAYYWLYNDTNSNLSAGTEFGVELEYNNKQSPDLLNGLVQIAFLGYVKSDGSVRTADSEGRTFQNIGGFVSWTPKLTVPFVTPDDLLPGEAIALAVKPFFSAAELKNEITPKSVFGIIPAIRTQSGEPNPLWDLLPGGVVFARDDQYRVVTGLGLSIDILSGVALVGRYSFPSKPRRTIAGLQPNTAGQKVIINGDGAVYIEPSTYQPMVAEAIRAIVSTVSGESAASDWSDWVAIASGQGLKVNVTYPTSIRSNYPDVIALSDKAVFNPRRIKIYVQRQDTLVIRAFSGFGIVTGEQEFEIADFDGAVSTLPTVSADFSLFAPNNPTAIALTSGTFTATNYRVAIAFDYDGNQITGISHASPPCITEWEGDFRPASVSVGTVTSLPPGSLPIVTNSSVASNVAVLNFSIPKGDTGDKGDRGEKGDTGDAGLGFNFAGEYRDEDVYNRNDVVFSDDNLWVCTEFQCGDAPNSLSTQWQLFLPKGATGATGLTGKSIHYSGNWNSISPYNQGTIVKTDNRYWVAKAEVENLQLYQDRLHPITVEGIQCYKTIQFSANADHLTIEYLIAKRETFVGIPPYSLQLSDNDLFGGGSASIQTVLGQLQLSNYLNLQILSDRRFVSLTDSTGANIFFNIVNATIFLVKNE